MTKLEALKDLLAKVEAGEAAKFTPDYEYALFPIKGMWSAYKAMDAYDGSLDAAKALHEAVLDGWMPLVVQGCGDAAWMASVRRPFSNGFETWNCGKKSPDTPARAWLIAIIKALIAEEEATA